MDHCERCHGTGAALHLRWKIERLSLSDYSAVSCFGTRILRAKVPGTSKNSLPWLQPRTHTGLKEAIRGMQLRGGGKTADWPDWVPLAFQLLPLTTRWLISFQCILFLLGHLMPDHPCFGANGGAVSSLGFDPVQILQPLFMGRTGDSARAGFSTGKRLAVVTVFLQSYRALTHVVVHASLPHILFNMYSFASVGQRLERLVGSVGLLQVVVVLAFTEASVLVTCEALLLACYRRSRILRGPLVGFSGVIFGLITVDSLLAHPEAKVTIFGVQVPARVFPLPLLLLQWVLFPSASVWGHAAGIAAGGMMSGGLLKSLKLSKELAKHLDTFLRKQQGYIRGPRHSSPNDVLISHALHDLWRVCAALVYDLGCYFLASFRKR